MPKPKLRKPNFRLGGFEVRICGRQVTQGVVCTLPPHHNPGHHAAIAMDEDGAIIAIVVGLVNTDVEMWQLVAAPESPK